MINNNDIDNNKNAIIIIVILLAIKSYIIIKDSDNENTDKNTAKNKENERYIKK